MKKPVLIAALALGSAVFFQACDQGNDVQDNAEESDATENVEREMTEDYTDSEDEMDSEGTDRSSKEMEDTDLVPTGTYKGTAERVDPEEKEIYVTTDDGKTLELYLNNKTKLMQNGEEVNFSALKKGQQLQVKVENKGNHLQPLAVSILAE